MWADETVTITWLPSTMTEITKAGTASVADLMTVNNLTYSSDVSSFALRKNQDSKNWAEFKFTTASNKQWNKDDYAVFSVTIAEGVTFTPTQAAVHAGGSGSGNSSAAIFATKQSSNSGSAIKKDAEGGVDLTLKSFSKTSYTAGETLTFYVHMGANSGKGVSLCNVVLTGTYVKAATDKPAINGQPASASYEVGDSPAALTIAATASAGDLSYQWYSNTSATTEGATTLTGETESSYTPSTASAGTTYYYCAVTDNGGTTNSEFATISVVNAFNPSISYASATNSVTITYEGTGTVYYTTDNSEPTTSSTVYTTPFTLENTSTVRAVAIKGENASEIVFQRCKVDHSGTALAVIGFGDGTQESGTWISNDGNYILKSDNGSEIQYYTVFSGQDGFKVNHSNGYTLKVSDNVKVTSIKFVGISRGDAKYDATIALTGFTPELGTIEMGTFVKTIEFTPTTALGYGATIEITTGGNQFGGYFEIYGEEYTKTATIFEETTWDFTDWSDATKNGLIADTENWNQYEKTGSSGTNFGDNGRSIAISRSNNSLLYKVDEENSLKIAETNGLKFTCGEYGLGLIFNLPSTTIGTYHGGSYIWLYSASSKIIIENVTKGSIIEIGVESHKDSEARGITLSNATQTEGEATATAYQVCKWKVTTAGTVTITPTKGLHIYYITLKKAVDGVAFTPAYDKTTYVTTKALDFSKVSPSGLNAYVATAAGSGSIMLEEVTTVPAGTPLMLIGTAGTKYTVPVAESATAPETNLFKAGDGTTEFDGGTYDYILFTDGLFYQLGSGTVATTKAYLHCDSDPTIAGARALTISFGNQTTAISEMGIVNSKATTAIYDLQGRRVAQPAKGLYIKNGKKVLVK